MDSVVEVVRAAEERDALPDTANRSRKALCGLLTAVGLLKLLQLGVSLAALQGTAPEELGRFASGEPLAAWDSHHYHTILTEGYPPRESDGTIPWVAGFFPLYPLSAWPLSQVVSPELALLLAANAASLAGVAVFYRWCESATGDWRAALLAGVLLVSYPPAMFFTAAYSEGLFLLLTATMLWGCQRKQFWLAALATGLATATRPTGVALLPVLLLMALRDMPGWPWRPASWGRLLGLTVVGSSGLLAFAGYEYVRYDDVAAYVRAQATYGATNGAAAIEKSKSALPGRAGAAAVDRLIANPTTSGERMLQKLTSPGAWNRLLAWGALGFAIACLPYAARRLPWPYLLLPVLIFGLGYLPGMGVRITSIARFMTAALPMFLVAALLMRHWPRVLLGTLCAAGIAVQLIYVWIFTRGGWCG